jgi:tetratricopeptide (TPR) repeat protein
MNNAGRNDPCPCGSGKKYKNCCQPADAALVRRTALERLPERHFIAELRPDLEKAVEHLMQRLERGERKGLEGEFRALFDKNRHHHLTNYAMGVYLAVVQENPRGALPFFQKAVRLYPPLAEGHYNVGNCYVKIARVAEATAAFREAIRYSDPGDPAGERAKERLCTLERMIRDTSPFQTLDAYVENQRLFDQGFEQLSQRSYDKAAELFKRVLEQYPNHVSSYGNLALAVAGLGQKAAALECIEKALALDPDYEPAITNRRVIETMKEGETPKPLIFARTEYYLECLEKEKAQRTSLA